ncbi:MacB-like periplasmic core domain protein [uncultured archaeon]|nr:MacB-like periplasmic core domain protein [uncultured archaeon]
MKKDYFILALGNLRHRGLRSWLTILGVFIGIAAVVALITMGNGLRDAVTGQFSTLSTDKLVIQNAGTGLGPPGSTTITKLNEHDVQIINQVSGVEEVVPRLIRVVKIIFNKNADFGYITSIPNNAKQQQIVYDSANLKINDGKLLGPEDSGKIILGSDVAKGDVFGKQINLGNKILIQGKNFEVIGILKPSSSLQINQVIFMNEKDLEDLLGIKNEYDMIVVQVSDSKDAEAVADRIKEVLRKDRKEKIGEEDFSVQTPLEAISSVSTILNIINLIVAGIAAISLLVGGIGIANTMYTSVLERTKEIGTMKAIGAKNKEILYIFVIESGLLGLIGGIIGAVLGIGLAFLVSAIANSIFGINLFVVQLSYPLIFGSIGFAFAIGFISGLMPALQASKLKPVEALRK